MATKWPPRARSLTIFRASEAPGPEESIYGHPGARGAPKTSKNGKIAIPGTVLTNQISYVYVPFFPP